MTIGPGHGDELPVTLAPGKPSNIHRSQDLDGSTPNPPMPHRPICRSRHRRGGFHPDEGVVVQLGFVDNSFHLSSPNSDKPGLQTLFTNPYIGVPHVFLFETSTRAVTKHMPGKILSSLPELGPNR